MENFDFHLILFSYITWRKDFVTLSFKYKKKSTLKYEFQKKKKKKSLESLDVLNV